MKPLLLLSKIKNIISLRLDDANNYLTYSSNIRLHKTKKIILDFEEYRYKVIKHSYRYFTYFFTMQTMSIKKYVWFGPTLDKVILLDTFEVDMNIENPSYSKELVTSTINSSLARYKTILARKAEIDNGDII